MKFFDRLLTIIITATLTSAVWIIFGGSLMQMAEDREAMPQEEVLPPAVEAQVAPQPSPLPSPPVVTEPAPAQTDASVPPVLPQAGPPNAEASGPVVDSPAVQDLPVDRTLLQDSPS